MKNKKFNLKWFLIVFLTLGSFIIFKNWDKIKKWYCDMKEKNSYVKPK